MAEAIARAHPRVRLTTTDADPAMVEAAQDRLAGFPLTQARQADATRLPFEDESFDTVLSFLMLHHVLALRLSFGGPVVRFVVHKPGNAQDASGNDITSRSSR